MKKNLIILLKYDSKIMNVLKSIIKELDQQKMQKLLKVHMRIQNNLLTS